jgi:hypothetical protein
MAVLKSSEGIFLNNYYSLNNNYGCKIHTSTRTWAAYQTGINNFEIYQSGTTSTRQTISIALKWAAIRTSGSKTELPALHASARASLNTNGAISFDSGWDWHAYGGNGILWPYIGMGGSSIFIGADSGASTGVIGSAWITICVLEWDKLVVNPYSD